MFLLSTSFKTIANLFRRTNDEENDAVTAEAPSTNTRKRPRNEIILETAAKRRKPNLRSYLENECSINSILRTDSLKTRCVQKNETSTKNPVTTLDIKQPIVLVPDIQNIFRTTLVDSGERTAQKEGIAFRENQKIVLEKTGSCQKLIGNKQDCVGRSTSRLSFPPAICTRSRLCLIQVHKEQQAASLFQMVRKYAPSSAHRRKSAMHNAASKSSNRTNLSSNTALTDAQNVSTIDQIDLTDEIKTDEAVIDLTSEDDDDSQQLSVDANVTNSPEICNCKKSSKVVNRPVVDPEYVVDLTKTCEQKTEQSIDTRSQRLRRTILDSKEEIDKSLAEVFGKRLTTRENAREPGVEHRPAWEIVPITASMISIIDAIKRSKRVPLVKIQNEPVTLHDIQTLDGTNWLNDAVINSYMKLIQLRAENYPGLYPKVYCFNTFWYPTLKRRGYNSVRRWTKKVDIFACSIIIIPIHLGQHWCLVEVRVNEQRVLYYDSFGLSGNTACLKKIMQYLVDEYSDKKDGLLDGNKWNLENVRGDEIPKQTNVHDCGVFACTYAEHITRRSSFNFDELHMPYFRLKMKYEILTGSLLL